MTRSPRAWSGIVWVPVALSAGAAAFPGAAPAFLAAALFALLALPSLAPDFLRRPGLLGPAAALFLFACGLAVYRQPGGPFDLFEDGQILAAADAYGRADARTSTRIRSTDGEPTAGSTRCSSASSARPSRLSGRGAPS